jgi:branched-chain amino acid transport system substrate-binding protein
MPLRAATAHSGPRVSIDDGTGELVMKSKISVTYFACSLVLAAALFAGVPVPQGYAADPIKIGVVVPITSVLAPYGKPFVESLQIAVDEANEKGGINGRKIELLVEDNQASNTVTINALNRVLEQQPVAVFGAALGTQVLAMMPITEREKVPLIAGPSTRRVTQQGAKYFFRIGSHDALDKEAATRFMAEVLKTKKIGILHVANEWGYSGRDNVSDYLKKLYNLAPVSIASYQPTDKDLTAQILQMRDAGADGIFSQGHPVDEALLVKQLDQLGIKLPHVASGSLCISFLRQLVTPDEIAGHYCEAPDVLPPFNQREQVRAFVAKYQKRTGYAPDAYPTLYYDGMGMMVEAMKKYGPDREKIRQAFGEMSYEGVLGAYKADQEDNLWHRAVVMKFLPGGKIDVVRQLDEKF